MPFELPRPDAASRGRRVTLCLTPEPLTRADAVVIRNLFGVAGAAHRNGGRYCMRYAWPSGRWGSLPLEGGIEAAYRAEIDAAADPGAKLREIEERLEKLRSPFRSAETFWIEEIIDPRAARPLLCEFANLAEPLPRR